MKTFLLSTFLSCVLVVFFISGVDAQQDSISGDSVCGSSKETICTPEKLKQIASKFLVLLASLGSAVLVIIIISRLVQSWFAYRAGNANAIKEASSKAFQSLIGFAIILSIFGGVLLMALQLFGTQEWATGLLRILSSLFIESAYAQEEGLLPNPYGSNSLYDIILGAAELAMRFFIYPAIIFMWVASGFQFIYAQGNPEGLKKAKSWLLFAFIITIVAFSLQAFLLAFRETAEDVFGGAGVAYVETCSRST